jgi:hypothetical protein
MLRSKSGKISWTKIAGAVFAAAGAIAVMPVTVVPAVVIAGAKVICAIAVGVGANGVRNAIDKAAK